MKTIAIIFAASYLILMVGGCAPRPTFGDDEPRMVKLLTKPDSGYELYVIPYEAWPAQNPASLLNDPTEMEKYRKGVSPLEIQLLPYLQVLVVKKERSADPAFPPKYFTPGVDSIVTVDCTPPR